MKKSYCLVVAISIVISLFAGCEFKNSNKNLPDIKKVENQEENISQNINFDGDKLIKKDLFCNSVRPFLKTKIPYQNWDNSNNIPVEDLINLYFLNAKFDTKNWETIGK